MRHFSYAVLFFTVMIGTQLVHADISVSGRTDIRIAGRSSAVVADPMIRLSDIAEIESPSISDDEAIVELRKLVIATSPKAGKTDTLLGVQVLEKLQEAGVRLRNIVYNIPKEIAVTRAYREVGIPELEVALKSFLQSGEKNIELKQLVKAEPIKIPVDSFGVEVVGIRPLTRGHFGIDYRSKAGAEEVRFQMKALADEWKLMPVATRVVRRGEVVTADDVRLTKVNGTAVHNDSVSEIGDVVGREAKRDIGQGEMFRISSIEVPPVIKAGARVSMVYRRGRLEAEASGVALEAGGERQLIKVRNEVSKRVVTARVLSPGLVEVGM
jgi:flagellar basal body P-ring formation protein FlgA